MVWDGPGKSYKLRGWCFGAHRAPERELVSLGHGWAQHQRGI